MELFYAALFGLMAVAAAALELGKPRETNESSLSRDFVRFSRNYTIVYALMMGELTFCTLFPARAKQSSDGLLVHSLVPFSECSPSPPDPQSQHGTWPKSCLHSLESSQSCTHLSWSAA